MKAFLIYSLTLATVLFSSSLVVKDISQAMRTGEVMILEKHLADAVDVTVLKDQAYLNKAKALDKVNAFFETNNVQSYKLSHKGTSKGAQSLYTIGTLKTENGAYEVYIFISMDEGKHQIEEIKIE